MALVVAYRRLKRDLGLMDFSDQIELGARLAVEQPEVGVVEREKFRVVLLDEYQDTSVAQATMLSRLFGGGHAVTAVGDPNQAIYGWRGASVSNILHFADTFPSTGTPGAGPHLPAHRQPALRPPHPRDGQPAGRAALRQVRRPGRPPRSQARRRPGRRSPRACCRPRPTSSPGWPTRSRPPTRAGRCGPTSVCSRATTPTPPTCSTRSPPATSPSRSSVSPG